MRSQALSPVVAYDFALQSYGLDDAIAARVPPAEDVVVNAGAVVRGPRDLTACRRAQRSLRPHWERWASGMEQQPGCAHYRIACLAAGALSCVMTEKAAKRRDCVVGALTTAEMAHAELGDAADVAWGRVRRALELHLPRVADVAVAR